MSDLDDSIPPLPDLELAGPPVHARPGPSAPPPPHPPASELGALDIDGLFDEPPPGLIDVEAVLRGPSPASASGTGSRGSRADAGPAAGAPPSAATGAAATRSSAPPPSAAAQAPPPPAPAPPPAGGPAGWLHVSFDLDPGEVAALADYGPPPRVWHEYPLYALRVFQRRRELSDELVKQRALLLELQDAYVARLSRMAEALRRRSDLGAGERALLAPLARFDEVASARGHELEEVNRQLEGEVAAVDRQVGEIEPQATKANALLREAEEALRRAEEGKERAEAKVKRVDIELRAAYDAARVAAGPGAKFAPPEHAARIKDLEAERDVRIQEARPATAAWALAADLARQRHAAERELRRRLASLREERLRIEQIGAQRVAQRSKGAKEAERDKMVGYAEVGRELLQKMPDALPPDERAAATESERLVRGRAREVEKHVQAIASADPKAERTGRIALASMVAVCLLLFALAIRALMK